MDKQQAALMVLGNVDLGPNKTPQLDPVLIGIITQVLEWAIPKCATWLMSNKKKPGPTPAPGMVKMMLLRRQTKLAFKSSGKGIADYRKHGEATVQAMLKSYNEATPEQIASLVKN